MPLYGNPRGSAKDETRCFNELCLSLLQSVLTRLSSSALLFQQIKMMIKELFLGFIQLLRWIYFDNSYNDPNGYVKDTKVSSIITFNARHLYRLVSNC